jgi:hypothetical protein
MRKTKSWVQTRWARDARSSATKKRPVKENIFDLARRAVDSEAARRHDDVIAMRYAAKCAVTVLFALCGGCSQNDPTGRSPVPGSTGGGARGLGGSETGGGGIAGGGAGNGRSDASANDGSGLNGGAGGARGDGEAASAGKDGSIGGGGNGLGGGSARDGGDSGSAGSSVGNGRDGGRWRRWR